MAVPFRRMCMQCFDNARLSHQRAKKTGQSEPHRHLASAVCVDHSWTLSLSTENLKHRRSHPGAQCMRSLRHRRIKTPGSTDNHGTEGPHRNTVQVGCSFHYRCCPGTQHGSGRVCVAFSNAAATRGGAAQAVFSIAKPHTTGDLRYELKASSIGDWYGQQKVGRTQ